MSKPGGDPSSGISSVDVLIPTERHPACRQREARLGCRTERENLRCVTPPAFRWWREGTIHRGIGRGSAVAGADRKRQVVGADFGIAQEKPAIHQGPSKAFEAEVGQ